MIGWDGFMKNAKIRSWRLEWKTGLFLEVRSGKGSERGRTA